MAGKKEGVPCQPKERTGSLHAIGSGSSSAWPSSRTPSNMGCCRPVDGFGLDRKTIREWRDRWRPHGMLGLVPRYPERRPSRVPEDVLRLLEHARRELGYGAPRTRIWLLEALGVDLVCCDQPHMDR